MRTTWAPVAIIAGSLLLSAAGNAFADRRDRNWDNRYQYSGSYRYYPTDWNNRYDRDRYDRDYRWDRDDRRDRERWRLEEARRHRIEEEREERRERERARFERGRDRDRDRYEFRHDRRYRD